VALHTGVAEVAAAAAAAVAAGKEETRTSGESAACAMCHSWRNGCIAKTMHLISQCLRCFAAAKALLDRSMCRRCWRMGRCRGASFPCLWELEWASCRNVVGRRPAHHLQLLSDMQQ
jgi:hypothetical protein